MNEINDCSHHSVAIKWICFTCNKRMCDQCKPVGYQDKVYCTLCGDDAFNKIKVEEPNFDGVSIVEFPFGLTMVIGFLLLGFCASSIVFIINFKGFSFDQVFIQIISLVVVLCSVSGLLSLYTWGRSLYLGLYLAQVVSIMNLYFLSIGAKRGVFNSTIVEGLPGFNSPLALFIPTLIVSYLYFPSTNKYFRKTTSSLKSTILSVFNISAIESILFLLAILGIWVISPLLIGFIMGNIQLIFLSRNINVSQNVVLYITEAFIAATAFFWLWHNKKLEIFKYWFPYKKTYEILKELGVSLFSYLYFIFIYGSFLTLMGMVLYLWGDDWLQSLKALSANNVENIKNSMNLTFLAETGNSFTMYLFIVFIIPIIEEIFFRGVLFTGLRKKINLFGSIFISSFIFSLLHIENALGFLYLFFLGGLLAFRYEKSGNLYSAIAIHCLNNFLSLLI